MMLGQEVIESLGDLSSDISLRALLAYISQHILNSE